MKTPTLKSIYDEAHAIAIAAGKNAEVLASATVATQKPTYATADKWRALRNNATDLMAECRAGIANVSDLHKMLLSLYGEFLRLTPEFEG